MLSTFNVILAQDFGETLAVLLVIAFFAIPLYPALKSAKKGVHRDEALLPCSACKKLIPATSTVCPYCRRSAGHDIFSRRGKQMDGNIKDTRFVTTYVWALLAEIIIILVVGVLAVEVLGFGK